MINALNAVEKATTVDFYFDFSSTNSYFAAFLLPEICTRHHARLNWLPLHLAALFRGTGFDVMAMTARKARYLWRDHQRYAELTGLPFKRPTRFPIKTSAALRSVLAVSSFTGPNPGASTEATLSLMSAAVASFTQEMFRRYWEFDEDISQLGVIEAVAHKVGLDGPAVLKLSEAAGTRAQLAKIVDQAVARGVFGAPTFFVGHEMFWGKDRLDFVERWLIQRGPFGS